MLLWALAAASVVFWAMRLATTAAPIPDGTRLAMNGPLAGGDLSRLLGAARVEAGAAAVEAPPAASRFRLTGIVSTSSKRGHDDSHKPGVALISVDGGPVRAYRVGEALDSQLSLWSVALRSARIGYRSGTGREPFVLELPPPAAPATGTLTAAGTPPAPMMPVPGFGATAPAVGTPPPMMMSPMPSGAPPAFIQQLPPPGSQPSSLPQPQPMPPDARQGVSNSAVMRQ